MLFYIFCFPFSLPYHARTGKSTTKRQSIILITLLLIIIVIINAPDAHAKAIFCLKVGNIQEKCKKKIKKLFLK